MKEDPNQPKTFFFDKVDKNINYKETVIGLPRGIDQTAFKNDIYSMFSPKNQYRQRFPLRHTTIEEQVKRPKKLRDILDGKNYGPLAQAEIERTHEFMDNFRETKLFEELLDAFNYDSEKTAKFFLSMLRASAMKKYKPNVNSMLQQVLKEANNSALGEIIKHMDKETLGKMAGDGSQAVQFLQKAQEIAEALPRISIRYKSASRKNVKKKEIVHPEDDLEPRNIRNNSEIPFVSEMMMEDDLFFAKLAKKELQTAQHYKTEHIAKKYGMLIDTSGSMHGASEIYACASAISLVQNALEGANEVDVILFDGSPRDAVHFENLNEVVEFMMRTPFSGGGTRIDSALQYADTKEYDELILITDGEDHVRYDPKTPLFTTFIGRDGENWAANTLRKISVGYDQVDPQ
jgi:uncharacterized protein with von Willebrand factor type A (vWA) domain